MTIGELLELQTEIWYDRILITTEERNDPLYTYNVYDKIPIAVLNLPASRMNVNRSFSGLMEYDQLDLVIYL